jgi:hypothetical protein
VLQGDELKRGELVSGGFPKIDECVEDLDEETLNAARVVTAGFARNADELRTFLDILGLTPGAPPIRDSATVRNQIRRRSKKKKLTPEQKARREALRREKFLRDKWAIGDPMSEKELLEIGKLFDTDPDRIK